MRIGYGKIGRSMPLTLEKCGYLGGDVEQIAVVKKLAEMHPNHEFVLIGRNSGERPEDVGLPSNVSNPWIEWGPQVRRMINAKKLNHPNLSIDEHRDLIYGILLPLIQDTFVNLDGIVAWVGQHGTSNSPLPSVQRPGDTTKPYDWATLYGSYMILGINAWRDVDPIGREEVLLNADPRNYVKYRDMKWPLRHPVLTQYDFVHNAKHERFGDARDPDEFWRATTEARRAAPTIWSSTIHNRYVRLEINGLLPGTPFGDLISWHDVHEDRRRFGMFINEARREVNPVWSRLNVVREWVIPLEPDWIHGTWTTKSQVTLGHSIEPVPWDNYIPKLQSVHSTFTTPSSGSAWATTKPWEAFAVGTVCFFHPRYDSQNHILGDAPRELQEYLRVHSPEQLRERVDEVHRDATLWRELIRMQREHFINATRDPLFLRHINHRLFGDRIPL